MRALLVHNLRSGQRDRRREIAEAVARLSTAGWQVEVAASAEVQEMEQSCRQGVAGGVEAVVAAGGDGTLNVAVQVLAGQRAALGVLPIGTANMWAKEMRIPMDVRGATEVLLAGRVARMDLGQANGRYFLSSAGVGFNASVTRVLKPGTKRQLGILAYLIAGATMALQLRGEEVVIVSDAHWARQRVLMLVASNIRLYGGVVTMAPQAFVDDGLLDVGVFRGRGLSSALRHFSHLLLGWHTRDQDVQFFQSSGIYVGGSRPLPVHLDGDYFGTTPVTLRVVPRALRVLLPSGPHPEFLDPRTENLSESSGLSPWR